MVLHDYLRRQVLPYAAYYRELFQSHGLRAEHVRTHEDLSRVPFTSKLDLLPTPERPERALDFILLPGEQALARRWDVVRRAAWRGRAAVRAELTAEYRPIFLTSTTGRSAAPVAFLYTQHDLANLARSGRHLMTVSGARPDDRLLNLFPYAPHLAFWQAHYAAEAHGVFLLSTGGGKVMGTEGNLRVMSKIKPRGIIGMPTFVYHLLSEAREEGRQFPDLGVLVLGGEKLPPGMRRKLRELARELGSRADTTIVATYGFTESKMAWGECPYPDDGTSGGYHLYPDLGVVEIVDPRTGVPVGDGEPGEIVFTALDARGSVAIRYRTGDVIDGGLVYGSCPHCGRVGPRLVGNIGRQSEVRELRLDKIKGTLVDFNELEHVLDDAPAIGAWQLEIRKVHDDPLELDELILHVENRTRRAHGTLEKELSDTLMAHTELRPNAIEFHSAREMRRRQGVGVEIKERRLVDNRPRDGQPAPPREAPGNGAHGAHRARTGES
ncbi:MAG: AMP-binding protein [Lentisphaerae bacterium]|nr:AMP-binding protein [Lentisphaerota bacterium]